MDYCNITDLCTVCTSDVKLKFLKNRNSNQKNRLKLETCFLLYPSSMVRRVRISTFEFYSCLYGPNSFAFVCMKLIIFTSYNLQTCVNDIIKLYMWTCIHILFTTYKHGRAVPIAMRYKIRLWVLYKLLYMVNFRSQLLYLSILFTKLHLLITVQHLK